MSWTWLGGATQGEDSDVDGRPWAEEIGDREEEDGAGWALIDAMACKRVVVG